ncbi:hypothetical protein BJX76DRAFT_323076 [Aspergillus varians]
MRELSLLQAPLSGWPLPFLFSRVPSGTRQSSERERDRPWTLSVHKRRRCSLSLSSWIPSLFVPSGVKGCPR